MQSHTYTYRELQVLLKAAKAKGLSDIKLNAKFEILEAEYIRLHSYLGIEVQQAVIEVEEVEVQEAVIEVEEVEVQQAVIEVEEVEEVEVQQAVIEVEEVEEVEVQQAVIEIQKVKIESPINSLVWQALTTLHSFKKVAKLAKEFSKFKKSAAKLYDYQSHTNWVRQAWNVA